MLNNYLVKLTGQLEKTILIAFLTKYNENF